MASSKVPGLLYFFCWFLLILNPYTLHSIPCFPTRLGFMKSYHGLIFGVLSPLFYSEVDCHFLNVRKSLTFYENSSLKMPQVPGLCLYLHSFYLTQRLWCVRTQMHNLTCLQGKSIFFTSGLLSLIHFKNAPMPILYAF